MRMAADELRGYAFDHITEIEGALLLRHAGMEDDLEEKVAEFLSEMSEVAFGDGVGHLVGFLERIRRNRLKTLLKVPRTPAAGRTQGRHDLDQSGNVAGRLHRDIA